VFTEACPTVEPLHSTAARAISVRGELVVKTQEPGPSQRERLRTLAGRLVGEQTGLFVVPDIIAFDDARGEIAFERLALTNLHGHLADPDRSVEIAGRAAEVLAAIHGLMQPPEDTRVHRGGMVIDPHRALVPLHGDFALTNVLYLPASDQIAVIDWSNAEWTGMDADLGAPEIDVAVFLVSLFHRRLFGPWPVSDRHRVARHFLARYASLGPHGLEIEMLRRFVTGITPAFVRMTRRLKGPLRALAFRHGMVDLAYFLRGVAPNRPA
jgi:Phosphotransferase enzyme family